MRNKILVHCMELLIAAGISVAGWALSNRGIESRKPQTPQLDRAKPHVADPSTTSLNEQPSLTSKDLMKQYEDAAKARWTAAQNPEQSRIIAHFFSSVRKQHTNDAIKQRRMEVYTGNDPTWKPKRESEARFQPTPQNITSGGTAGNAPTYSAERQAASVSGVQNNILPFQQVRVGPGVGVDTSVPATDGFHSMYRVMPVDATGYKTNTLEGRVVPGVSQISAREVDPAMESKVPQRFYTMERRPLAKGRAAVTARTHRPTIARYQDRAGGPQATGCHVVGDCYFGGAGLGGQNVSAGEAIRSKSDLRPGLPLTNVKGGDGPGAFTHSSFDAARFASQQREMEGTNGTLTGNGYAPRSQVQFIGAPTKRELSSCQGVNGGAGHMVPTGTIHPLDVPQPTLREQLHDHSNGCAPAAPIHTGRRVQCTNKQLLKESKRGSQVVSTYVPTAERTTEFARANLGIQLPRYVVNHENLRQKCDAGDCRVLSHAQSGIVTWNQGMPGQSSTEGRNRLPEINKFQDFTIAKTNLRGNDLAVTIN